MFWAQGVAGVSPEAIAAAGELYEKCVACARLAKDERLAGVNCFRLGKVFGRGRVLSGPPYLGKNLISERK